MGIQSDSNSLRNFKLGLFVKAGNPADSLNDGLMWYYPLEAATGDRIDSGLGKLDVAQTGTVTNSVGVIGNAATFPGANGNLLSRAFNAIDDLSATNFSMSGWFQASALGSNQEIVYMGTGNRSAGAMVLDIRFFSSQNKIEFAVSDGSSTNVLSPSTTIPVDTWVFWCVRYNFVTKKMELRLDGNAFESEINPNGALHSPGTQQLVIGSHLSGNVATCCIDEVGGWNRLITDKEVDYLYSGGSGGRPDFTAIETDELGNILTDELGNVFIAE